MVIDTLSNLGFYAPLNRRIASVEAYLRGTDLDALPDGKYAIDGDAVFMTLCHGDLRPAEEAPLEAHDRYMDIQIVLSGEETYGWRSREECSQPEGTYSAERDIVFFRDTHRTRFVLGRGGTALFFPGDAHAPLIGEGRVRKCIVKVLCP